MMPMCQDGKLIKGWNILLQFRRWSRIALSFDCLTFLKVKDDIPICSPDLTFNYLSISL